MPNQQLVDYIKSQLKAGVTKPDLEKAIQSAGWTQADMKVAFDVVEGKVPVTPPAPTPTPQPIKPISTQPMPQMQPVKPIQPISDSMRPAAVTSEPARTWRLRSPIGMRGLLVIVVLVIIAAGVVYFMPIIQPLVDVYLMPQPTQTITTQEPQTTQSETQTVGSTTPITTASSTASTTPSGVGATFDQNSLVTQSTKPTLTGTASGYDTIAVLVGFLGFEDAAEVSVSGGAWSHTLAYTLPVGTYPVFIFPVHNGTGDVQKDIASGAVVSTQVLASSSLMIENSSGSAVFSGPPATCTVTASPSTATPGSVVTLTWSAKNTTLAGLWDGSRVTTTSGKGQVTVTKGKYGSNATYVIEVLGPGGPGNCSTNVTVQ